MQHLTQKYRKSQRFRKFKCWLYTKLEELDTEGKAKGVQIYNAPTTRCITDLNYLLMIQGHRDCATHRVAEKDYRATVVYTSRQRSEFVWTATKKINCC